MFSFPKGCSLGNEELAHPGEISESIFIPISRLKQKFLTMMKKPGRMNACFSCQKSESLFLVISVVSLEQRSWEEEKLSLGGAEKLAYYSSSCAWLGKVRTFACRVTAG